MSAPLKPLPAWKQAADFLCVQVGFSLDDLLAWRSTIALDVPVYAGVIVIASARMARTFTIPGLTVPPDLVARLEKDRNRPDRNTVLEACGQPSDHQYPRALRR